MNTNSLSINDLASALGGAGLTNLNSNIRLSLLLIGICVLLKVAVALFNHFQIPVGSNQ